PNLVLLSVKPRNEEHLHSSATEPVTLLVVRLHPANTRAKPHGDHRCISRIAHRGNSHLPLCRGGTPNGSNFSVGPGLRTHPGKCIVAIASRWSKDVVISFREEMSALVHLDKCISALHCLQRSGHVGGDSVLYTPKVEVVRRAHKDRWVFLR